MLAVLDSLLLMSARMVQGCEHCCVSWVDGTIRVPARRGAEAVIPCAR